MKRRKAREYALQILYQQEYLSQKPDFELFWRDRDEHDEIRQFTQELVRGVLDNLDDVDETLLKAAEHWSLDRMAAVDRSLLRLAAYELVFRDDIPSAVTINEALEIAKQYSSGQSAPFINGILDRIAKRDETK